jgi:hypothetical protein
MDERGKLRGHVERRRTGRKAWGSREESLGVTCREETDGRGKLKEVTGDVIVGT